MRFSFKNILLNFYLVLQIFVVSMGLLCGSFSYAEKDPLKDFHNYVQEGKGHKLFALKKYKKAFKHLEKESQNGNINSKIMLGGMYYHGKGVPQDYKKAFELFKAAAQAGHKEIYYPLSVMYYEGQGVPSNYTKSRESLKKAAQAGMPDAYYKLGVMYRDGRGAYRNEEKSIEYFKLAAQAGHEEAQEYLSKFKNKKCIKTFNKGAQ